MPYREKIAWMSAVTTIAVWSIYFISVARVLFGSGTDTAASFIGLFVGCTCALIVIQIVATILVALTARKESAAPPDERERLAEARATRVAFLVLSVSVAAVGVLIPLIGAARERLFPLDPVGDTLLATCSGLLLALVAAEVVRSVGQIVVLRRG
jgi:hypothetical protein